MADDKAEVRMRIATESQLKHAAAMSGKTDEGLDAWAAASAKVPATHLTRVDRRFPNTNQASNCWCVRVSATVGCPSCAPTQLTTSASPRRHRTHTRARARALST